MWLNNFSIISFAGLLYPMGNPWFQESNQSMLQLSSIGAYTVLWNLDIWSRSAKQWINFKLLCFMWMQQIKSILQTHLGVLWHHFNWCNFYLCLWVREFITKIFWFWLVFIKGLLGGSTCSNLLGPYHCHSSNSYWVCASCWQVLQSSMYMLSN